jgi:hypothetical protein
VAHDFVRRHPGRLWLARRILAWPDLRSEAVLHEFVRTHPFVELRPSVPA